MPYSYHKEGDKYVVTKKDTGKEVGRTKGTKEALKKYLAALHINANESKINTMKKTELTKMIQEIIKEVINESAGGSLDFSSGTLPKPTPKEGEVYLKDLKPGNKFSVGNKLEYIVVNPKSARGVEVKYSDGTGYMHFRGDAIVKVISETGKVPKMSESADYDTAVAFRLVAKGNRDQALEALQSEINRITGPSGRFSKVKVTVIPSKGNPQDIIIKLNGPSAFSMGKDITAKDKTKAYTNPVIRNNFSKVSPYTPQLTKIS